MSSVVGPGLADFASHRVWYSDAEVFRVELKDIFDHQIYGFRARREAPVVLDCGAHIGMATIHAKTRYPAARVVAFEPDPDVCELLRRNVVANGLDDVEVIEAAVAAAEGRAAFATGRDAGRLDVAGGVEVRTVRLRDWLHPSIDFLKMNVEGAELEVLFDCADRLGFVEQLVVEYHGFEDRPQYLHELLALLDRVGFRYLVHDFDEKTNASTKPPFSLTAETRFFLLVYAKRLDLL